MRLCKITYVGTEIQWAIMIREEHGWERIYLASNSNTLISGNRSVTEAKGRRRYHNKAFVACWLFTSKTKQRGKEKGGLICLLKIQTVGERGEEKKTTFLTSFKPKE